MPYDTAIQDYGEVDLTIPSGYEVKVLDVNNGFDGDD